MALAHDKKLHFAVGALIAILVSLVSGNLWFGLAASAVAGVGKEVYDRVSKEGTPEVMDAVWTVIGGVTGCALVGLAMSGVLNA